jgi:branched-chain amino acid transport system ATP-binding protein
MLFQVQSLSVHRGPIQVLRQVDLEIEKGETVSLVGANGAGKTTLLWTIMGLLAPTGGKILFDGRNIAGLATDAIIRSGISLCPAERHIFPRMSVYENLMLGGYTLRSKKEIHDVLDYIYECFPVLYERSGQSGQTLSGGEQQMLAMARAMISKPALLLLDEPSLGLAPRVVNDLGAIIEKLNSDGTTILLVEQNALLALEKSRRTYVMQLGRIQTHGSSRDLQENEAVKRAYLGE